MKWIKNLFRLPKWRTVFTCKCTAFKSEFFGACSHKIECDVFVQVDDELNKYRCYFTDGDLTRDLDINILIKSVPDVKDILNKNGIFV